LTHLSSESQSSRETILIHAIDCSESNVEVSSSSNQRPPIHRTELTVITIPSNTEQLTDLINMDAASSLFDDLRTRGMQTHALSIPSTNALTDLQRFASHPKWFSNQEHVGLQLLRERIAQLMHLVSLRDGRETLVYPFKPFTLPCLQRFHNVNGKPRRSSKRSATLHANVLDDSVRTAASVPRDESARGFLEVSGSHATLPGAADRGQVVPVARLLRRLRGCTASLMDPALLPRFDPHNKAADLVRLLLNAEEKDSFFRLVHSAHYFFPDKKTEQLPSLSAFFFKEEFDTASAVKLNVPVARLQRLVNELKKFINAIFQSLHTVVFTPRLAERTRSSERLVKHSLSDPEILRVHIKLGQQLSEVLATIATKCYTSLARDFEVTAGPHAAARLKELLAKDHQGGGDDQKVWSNTCCIRISSHRLAHANPRADSKFCIHAMYSEAGT